MNILTIIILMAGGWSPLNINPWAECSRLVSSEQARLPFHLTGRVLLTDSRGRVVETQPFTWDSRDSLSCRYVVGPVEQIHEPGIDAIVDHQERVIRVIRVAPGAKTGGAATRLASWQALIRENRDSVLVEENGQGLRRLTAPGLQVVYRVPDYTLESVTLFDVEPGGGDVTVNRLEFRYETLERIQNGFPEPFYTPYLILDGKKARLRPAYTGYRLAGQ